MDFVISKVVMAICALLVIATLTGLFTEESLLGNDRGISHVLDEFCEIAARANMCESDVLWQTPFLLDGGVVTMSIQKESVLAESSGEAAARQLSSRVHLWRSDGRPLNESAILALDSDAGSLVFESGTTVEIVSRMLTYEDGPRIFVFVYLND